MNLLERLRSSVRGKLLAIVLLPLVVVLPMLVGMLVAFGGDAYDKLLIYKVRSDLAVADGYFERVKDGAGRNVGMLAASNRLARALATGRSGALTDFLRAAKQNLRLDFLHFVDARGVVQASSNGLPAGASLATGTLVSTALGGRESTVLDIFSAETLSSIDPELSARARIAIVPTRNAAPGDRVAETRGMVIHTAAPVYDEQGRLLGALVGGLLLNRNLEFVDRINEIIYPDGALPFGSHGTATLFLDDVRIATNVRLFQDERAQERAIGTRVSAAVRDTVLERGNTWLDRAFVVNDWYVSAYQPLVDGEGHRIGMLYVGYLEAPFRAIKRWALGGVIVLFVVAILLATLLSLRAARNIFRPIERMNQTMHAIEAGEAEARVGPLASRDEIGRLAGHFNQLLDKLHEQNAELRRWGTDLDVKVAARTRDLEEANRRLQDAHRQLALREKLAAIGELTAGVAHEINNPVAVIQGNLDLAREIIGPAAKMAATELDLIDQQVQRINQIVTRLLQFARPTEYAGYTEPVAPAAVIADALVLVRHEIGRCGIAVARDDTGCAEVRINRNELLQVLINLMVNAIHAMPGGGTLTLRSRPEEKAERPGVVVEVGDTGVGIPRADQDRIFDAFYTTKADAGTGLGLSISLTLVARYGGTIEVSSEPDQGSVFSVWLPAAQA
jgi:two-component system NtrC family sensor kinase